jgi:hypothetical protein
VIDFGGGGLRDAAVTPVGTKPNWTVTTYVVFHYFVLFESLHPSSTHPCILPTMGRMRPYQHRRPPRISMGDDRGSSSRCSGVCRHRSSSSTVVPFVVSDEEAFDHACKTWFDAPAGRAAEELRSLPKVERERVWADLTGTTPNQLCHPLAATATPAAFPHEDQATVQQALTDLRRLVVQSALEPLRSALQIQPDYICDPNYLIRFLRAKEFDIPMALEALHRHLTMKESLFGRACLTRDLCLDDLTEDDHHCLERGVYQFLPETDRAGRAVSFLNFADPSYSHPTMHSVVRFFTFVCTTTRMAILVSYAEPTQKNMRRVSHNVVSSVVLIVTMACTASDDVLFEYDSDGI